MLLSEVPTEEVRRAFQGSTYEGELDFGRLSNNLQRVYARMMDGKWHTPHDLRPIGGQAWDSRVRDLRGLSWGPLDVESERIKDGLWKYRIKLESWTLHIHSKIMEKRPDKAAVVPATDLTTTWGRAAALVKALGIAHKPEAVQLVHDAFRHEQRLAYTKGVEVGGAQ